MRKIYLNLNPTDKEHWLKTQYSETYAKEVQGEWGVPKSTSAKSVFHEKEKINELVSDYFSEINKHLADESSKTVGRNAFAPKL